MTDREREAIVAKQQEFMASRQLKAYITEKTKMYTTDKATLNIKTLYFKTDEYAAIISSYGTPMSISSYLAYMKLDKEYFNEYLNLNTNIPSVSEEDIQIHTLFKQVKQSIEADIVTGSLTSLYNTNISKIVLSADHEYSETVKSEAQVKQEIITIVDDIPTDIPTDNESSQS